MKLQPTLNKYIENSMKSNWDRLCFSDINGITLTFSAVARRVAKLHLLYEAIGVKPGDRIALCGRNSSQWAIAVLSCLTYGAVAVPILHDFKAENIHHLVNHSEAKLLFADKNTWDQIDPKELPNLDGIINLKDYSLYLSNNKELTKAREHLNEMFGKAYPERFTANDVHYYEEDPSSLALINYTSGSTGFSKGVMLSYRSIWSNIQFAVEHLSYPKPGDNAICMLPLAHMYGLSFELIHFFVKGCHTYFITKTPSPRVIMEAFAVVRPQLVITVPLIIEKIIKTRVFPTLEKPAMKFLMKVPVVDDKILTKIHDRLIAVFGGNLKMLVIGGAALNKEVEEFLRKIKFPFTVGYGMTECAPLISYAHWDQQRPGSCGKMVDRMELRVDSEDPENVPGVLSVKGENVMKGYYKNPEATREAIGEDGWLNTGDIVNVDKDGYIYIRGRAKSMLLGPSGQNIYPEEIEVKINNIPYVEESIVVDDEQHKLHALIHPDMEAVEKAGLTMEDLKKLLEEQVRLVNNELPAYSRIASVKIYKDEFEKTPKRSIKRYLYKYEE